MIIIGFDPGVAITGWGVIKKDKQQPVFVNTGVIRTTAKLALSDRLSIIFDQSQSLLRQFKPDVCVLEEIFFNTNAKTALLVGHARGVVMLACQKQKLPVFAYTPFQVKLAITGYGRADKNQMQQMVKALLKLPQIPKPDDAADALAVALTHGFSMNLKRQQSASLSF